MTVSDATELEAALSSSTGGEIILLDAGDYGSLALAETEFSDFVTLCGTDEDPGAVLTGIDLEDLRPVAGSDAETLGAFARIEALLTGDELPACE